jgi:chaperonin cofactor prefoldin
MKEVSTMNNNSFHEYLEKQIAICGKRQKVIAEELGYDKPNIITMFKQGVTKVPLNKVELLAKAIGIDPYSLLKKAMTEYTPGMWSTIEIIRDRAVTDNEYEMVKKLRNSSNYDDPLYLNEILEKQIAICEKPQKVISEELGYDKPNIISMFKQGKTKVPLTKSYHLQKRLAVTLFFSWKRR